jgi:hypothetical protein
VSEFLCPVCNRVLSEKLLEGALIKEFNLTGFCCECQKRSMRYL